MPENVNRTNGMDLKNEVQNKNDIDRQKNNNAANTNEKNCANENAVNTNAENTRR